MESMTVTSKGQVTIPKAVRDQMGLQGGDKVKFVKKDGEFHLQKDVDDDPIEEWVGYLKHLEGKDVDELIEEMRGR